MKQLKLLWTCGMFLLSSAVFAQVKITGNVTDPKGESIIGANVSVKGTTNGTITDFDGNFILNVTDGGTLVFTYIGYKPVERDWASNCI